MRVIPTRYGVAVTIPHVFNFGASRHLVGNNLLRPEAWDALRLNGPAAFSIATGPDEYAAQLDQHPALRDRAKAIIDLVPAGTSVASYGVGGALLEGWMHRLSPLLSMTVSDYAPATVNQLHDLLPRVRVHRHDLLRDQPLTAGLHLFHRVDTEFTDRQWRMILRRFARERVLLVASEIADRQRLVTEVRYRLQDRGATRAGWLRNRSAFVRLWCRTHAAEPVRVADLDGWVLSPR